MLPTPTSHSWHHTRHHTSKGCFRNLNPHAQVAHFSKAAFWFAKRMLQPKQNVPPSLCPIDTETLHTAPSQVRVTWIGHATLLLQWPDLTVLTDPMLSRRASPLSFAGPARHPECPLQVADLPPVDVVLVSHDHYDHLDRPSAHELSARFDPLFLAPLGVAERLTRWGIDRAVATDWWQYVDVDGWRFHCTPAQHFSGRGLLDRNSTLWAGWHVEPRGRPATPSLFFAGDTAYADYFTTLRKRIGAPDIACLPIGAYQPRWIMQPVHMDPAEAAQAFFDLGATHFVPIHWGTFDLGDEPIHEPAARIREIAAHRDFTDRLHLLDVGEMLEPAPVPG